MKRYQVQFPVIQGRVPVYTNVTLVNQIGEDVIIDFGFADPLVASQTPEGRPLLAHPMVRVALNRSNVETLIEQLKAALRKLEEVDGEGGSS